MDKGKDQWTTVKSRLPIPPEALQEKSGQRRRKKPIRESILSLPPESSRIRAVFLAFSGAIAGDAYVRGVCARMSIAIVRLRDHRVGIFNYRAEAPAALLEHLDALAGKSGHPEVATAPWVTAGCSTTTLTARNIAYWKPERTICAISFAGGNLHQNTDPTLTLKGVPFLCITGEWERYGPEGGIRPEYGLQTQWVMIREQLLRWRAKDPSYLVSLLVVPEKDHARWDSCVSRYTGRFIAKALDARVPASTGNGPAICRPIDPTSGWLTCRDINTPRHPPAPYAEFGGKPEKAFWHFDRILAEEEGVVHAPLWLPDPSRENPVPADWPRKR